MSSHFLWDQLSWKKTPVPWKAKRLKPCAVLLNRTLSHSVSHPSKGLVAAPKADFGKNTKNALGYIYMNPNPEKQAGNLKESGFSSNSLFGLLRVKSEYIN